MQKSGVAESAEPHKTVLRAAEQHITALRAGRAMGVGREFDNLILWAAGIS